MALEQDNENKDLLESERSSTTEITQDQVAPIETNATVPGPGTTLNNPIDIMGRLFESATSGGLFPLVAYGYDNERGYVLTTSIPRLPLGIEILQKIEQEFNLGRAVPPFKLTRLAQENPHVFKMKDAPISGLANFWRELGRVARTYGAPYYSQKGFGLVDICGFSRLDYPEQLAQLYSLTQVLGSSIRRFSSFKNRLRIGGVFGHASTGDGFYIWHDAIGGNADVATFAVLILILAQAEAMRVVQGFRMRLKASFFVGGAYMLYDRSDDGLLQVASNAVGPATNAAARLLTACRPGQLLLGDFNRKGQTEGERLTPKGLLAQVNQLFREEGLGAGDLTLEPDAVVRLEDKHGDVWHCWNVCGEVPNSLGDSHHRVSVGLTPDDSTDIRDLQFKEGGTRRSSDTAPRRHSRR